MQIVLHNFVLKSSIIRVKQAVFSIFLFLYCKIRNLRPERWSHNLKFKKEHLPRVSDIVWIHENAGSDWSFPLHQHEDKLELSYIVHGAVKCTLDDFVYTAHADQIIIKNAGIFHAESLTGTSDLEEICIGLHGIRLQGLGGNCLIEDTDLPVLTTPDEPLLKNIFLYLKNHEQTLEAPLKADLARVLISLTLQVYADSDMQSVSVSANTQTENAHEVKEYLNQNYARRISLTELGKRFFVSPSYLSRQFKNSTGLTIKQYIRNLRIGQAEKLLVYSDRPIKDIALACGYDNLQYFYTLFKQYTHDTPVDYRRKYKRQ